MQDGRSRACGICTAGLSPAGTPASCAESCCGRCCGGVCPNDPAGISLTENESALLAALAQFAFLPAAYAPQRDGPVCLELPGMTEEDSAAAVSLWKKRLISVDFDLPLSNFDYSAYADYERYGSIALTALGQELADRI